MQAALKACGGKLFGKGGAAELLGLKPATLASRLKRLDIELENCGTGFSREGVFPAKAGPTGVSHCDCHSFQVYPLSIRTTK